MLKAFFPGYIICFALYILFSRQPDYFDSEVVTGKILVQELHGQYIAKFREGSSEYRINAGYFLRSYRDEEPVKIIFEKGNPQKAAIYSWWGYWLTPGEIISSLLIPIAFWLISYFITRNPVPGSVDMEEMEQGKKRPKYDL